MTRQLQKGDKVSWDTSQGSAEDRVISKQTSQTKIKCHMVKASAESPRYIVRER
ncbi:MULTISPECIES: DUF2945 domain-containing protein [Rhizobium]|uniref:DUF2945 domain-containing protein n=1 Tax=Rhizobium TaxID=379 RepID=UPI001B33045B|nr:MULTISPECIES: DUF2945 domain-containing protein [Rhizobium]MBX4906244.1 DUF2945 domain-containing protein [Rhizobium bangladeshense]MBX5213103.1 DUF2945 domain-containing protein [Rhizobium sp. NLR9a]MBX5219892.1 DUF2945 domain-containing protein [Rhizobium sp. NLR8a]MBX5231244.1 DUF2945 domain-containing protein [Rhizobium sp. NLR4a]MBX5243370.1 DUF2945 domain-containing protein [Rhizobium sp. NLR3b]